MTRQALTLKLLRIQLDPNATLTQVARATCLLWRLRHEHRLNP